ncbi:hypothetical protein EDD18DRAFT_1104202 [Armillaria luteobubalina]|uniref:DUF6533 domain-containing protein n=1 Tax=Armillaria luteobubalina TaxID=153913 RepID=A0AA39Q7E3_9AGAR|nr:hypothetical protein EDD18DRAFT_1104202 [Armillaria luteobubalina]
MSMGALTHDELESLYNCISNGRMGNRLKRFYQGILFACAALFLFDFSLTFYDELRLIWKPRRITLTSVSFLLSRYPVLATTILILIPSYTIQEGNETVLLSQIAIGSVSVLRLASIVSSEFILAVRTWAIWEKSRRILFILIAFSVGPNKHCKGRLCGSLCVNHRVRECDTFFIPDSYNPVTAEGTQNSSSAIIRHIMERWCFLLFMDLVSLAVLGFLNIGLAVQSTIRVGGSQLQAIIHSILSCRIVLHLAGSRFPKDIDTSGCSLYTDATIQFTTQVLTEDITLSERSETRDIDSRDVEAASPDPRTGGE